MARGGVTYSEVAKAARQLLDVGVNPTVDAVRGKLGHTGSKSTIGPFLKQWKDQHLVESQEAASGLPAGLLDAVRAIYEGIVADADARVAQARAEFQARTETLQAEIQALKLQLSDTASARDALTEHLELERAAVSELRLANTQILEGKHALELRLTATLAELEASDHQLTTARAQFAHFEQTMVEQRRQDRADAAQRLADRDQQIVQLNKQLQELRNTNDQAATALAEARVSSAEMAQRVMRLQEAVDAAGTLQDRLDGVYAEARESWRLERERLLEQLGAASKAADVAEQELAAAARRHEALVETARLAQAERDRLQGRLEQLEKPPLDTAPAGDKA
jgi:DNA repair exonuclease SbcCD ATPase subunit